MISIVDCKEGYVYFGRGRNFQYALRRGREFLGIRSKFTMRFIDGELHFNECATHGTFRPEREIEQAPAHLLGDPKKDGYIPALKEYLEDLIKRDAANAQAV